jgi:hypothetical protein
VLNGYARHCLVLIYTNGLSWNTVSRHCIFQWKLLKHFQKFFFQCGKPKPFYCDLPKYDLCFAANWRCRALMFPAKCACEGLRQLAVKDKDMLQMICATDRNCRFINGKRVREPWFRPYIPLYDLISTTISRHCLFNLTKFSSLRQGSSWIDLHEFVIVVLIPKFMPTHLFT